jgi:hypothetical protein
MMALLGTRAWRGAFIDLEVSPTQRPVMEDSMPLAWQRGVYCLNSRLDPTWNWQQALFDPSGIRVCNESYNDACVRIF